MKSHAIIAYRRRDDLRAGAAVAVNLPPSAYCRSAVRRWSRDFLAMLS